VMSSAVVRRKQIQTTTTTMGKTGKAVVPSKKTTPTPMRPGYPNGWTMRHWVRVLLKKTRESEGTYEGGEDVQVISVVPSIHLLYITSIVMLSVFPQEQ